jgi:hypothetical protein
MNSLACSFAIGHGFPIIAISYVCDFTFVIEGTVERASLGVMLLIQSTLRYNQKVTYHRRILFGVSAFGIFKTTISRASYLSGKFLKAHFVSKDHVTILSHFYLPLFFSRFFLFLYVFYSSFFLISCIFSFPLRFCLANQHCD